VVITSAPGEEAQVDYGDGPMVRSPEIGKYRRTRLFVLTLGYSRKSVRLLTWRSSSQIWAELHERAFRRLGGTVRVVVYDYVPGHIVQLLCPRRICGPGRFDALCTGWTTFPWAHRVSEGRKPGKERGVISPYGASTV
jgi:hypothetical protein